MYDVDLELAAFQVGMPIKDEDIDLIKNHIEIIKEDKWFIKAFPEFQYGTLNPKVKAHASVMKILEKYKCLERVSNPLQRVKDKDIDINKVKEKGMDTSILEVSDEVKKSIGYRMVQFKNKVNEFADEYDKDMRIQFMEYWTESGGKKMRFEKEKVFEISKRLSRWKKNNFNNNETLPNFKMDSTGKFYIGFCQKCNKSDTYSQFELKQDSRCCQSKLIPTRG